MDDCSLPTETDEFLQNNLLDLESDLILKKPSSVDIEQPTSFAALNEDITFDQGFLFNNDELSGHSIVATQTGLNDLDTPSMLGDSGVDEKELTNLLALYPFDGQIFPVPYEVLVLNGTEIGGAMSGPQRNDQAEMEEQIAPVPIHSGPIDVAEKVAILNEQLEAKVQGKTLEQIAQNPEPGQSSSKRRSPRNVAKVPAKDKVTKQVSPSPCSASPAKRRRLGEKTTKMWQMNPDAVEDPAMRDKVVRSQSARKNREKQSETKKLLAEKAKDYEELTKKFEDVLKEKTILAEEKEGFLKKIDEQGQEIKMLQEKVDADNAKQSCNVICSKLKQSGNFSLAFMPLTAESQTQSGSGNMSYNMLCKLVFPDKGESNDKS